MHSESWAIDVSGVDVAYGGRRAEPIVRDVSFRLAQGATLGIVGESGSGKSTLAKAIVGLMRPTSGRIRIGEVDLAMLTGHSLRSARRKVQLVPQDPHGSLDPRMTIGHSIAEALDRGPTSAERRARTGELLETVALDPAMANRYPHEFSGGQRQRVAIARALAVRPDVLVADEITSALDCSVQAEILNLLRDLQATTDLSMIFISHDLAVVSYIAGQALVLRDGAVVETGAVPEIFIDPAHDYTRRLVSAVPTFCRTAVPDHELEPT